MKEIKTLAIAEKDFRPRRGWELEPRAVAISIFSEITSQAGRHLYLEKFAEHESE